MEQARLPEPDRVPETRTELGQISTEWALVFDSVQFVRRYALAIQKYLLALIKNSHDAEEVAQDFFLKVTEYGFPRAKRERGRFRDYLKVAVRNFALNFLERRQAPHQSELWDIPAPGKLASSADQEWTLHWRRCLLQRAWRNLEKHQERFPESIYYTALRLATAYPQDESAVQAQRAGTVLGRAIRADAFRKQLSRARRLFAEMLVLEIGQTLDHPTPELIEEELIDLGLMRYVRHYLPADWQTRLVPTKK